MEKSLSDNYSDELCLSTVGRFREEDFVKRWRRGGWGGAGDRECVRVSVAGKMPGTGALNTRLTSACSLPKDVTRLWYQNGDGIRRTRSSFAYR